MGTRVQQNPMTIGFHQRGEAPFAQTRNITHEHGGKHSDFERTDLRCRTGNVLSRSLGFR
jgi:hypothetical protein